MKEISNDCIGICEECCKSFMYEEMIRLDDAKWGHVCKEKQFKREHRCESYIKIYKEVI